MDIEFKSLMSEEAKNVTITIDDREVTVPQGTNLILAAMQAGIDIPYYCYHPGLSVAGNCRMCQVEVEGRPKLEIGCNTAAMDGMVVRTHHSSEKVADAQASTLEFILINHPLDCTVCDQSGHCKLQDYHFKYNARPSRFVEDKEHKVKAEPLGPHVVLDGERCIMCTRCIRFCDEVTETSELGMLNRGDRSVIAINAGRELDNALSGSVVDLCPVGALTHRDWRFNTRIWYTNEVDSICPGCSTGCAVRAATRDNQIVQIKSRYNPAVNQEWLCDEGRYGFGRFLPENRVTAAMQNGEECGLDEALKSSARLKGQTVAALFGAHATLEDYFVAQKLLERDSKIVEYAVSYRERELSQVEKILVSPDYAPNIRGAQFLGLAAEDAAAQYEQTLKAIRSDEFDYALLVGDWSILPEDLDQATLDALGKMTCVVSLIADADSPLIAVSNVVLPVASCLERSGMMINRTGRLHYLERLLEPPQQVKSAWRVLSELAATWGSALFSAQNDRDITLAVLQDIEVLSGLTIAQLKQGGLVLGDDQTVNSDDNCIMPPGNAMGR